MTSKAYEIRQHLVCGFDRNDVASIPTIIKSRYKKADIIYISPLIKNFIDDYFGDVPCKENVDKKICEMSSMAENVVEHMGVILCLVDISELEQLSQDLTSNMNSKYDKLDKSRHERGGIKAKPVTLRYTKQDPNDIEYEFHDSPTRNKPTSRSSGGVNGFFNKKITVSNSSDVYVYRNETNDEPEVDDRRVQFTVERYDAVDDTVGERPSACCVMN